MPEVKSKGIRISDSACDGACIDLNEILKELHGGGFFQWSIFEIYINGYYGTIPSVIDFENTAKKPSGKRLSWEQLSALGNDVNQFLDLIVIGSKDIDQLKWISKGANRYENCEFYIEMFDSSFWEVFSKDHAFINRLAHKFKDIKFLDSDFLEKEKS